MAIKTKTGKYACSFCGKIHDDPVAADACRESHDLVYVPFTRIGLNSIITFLYTKNEKDLDDKAVETLLKYRTLKQKEK